MGVLAPVSIFQREALRGHGGSALTDSLNCLLQTSNSQGIDTIHPLGLACKIRLLGIAVHPLFSSQQPIHIQRHDRFHHPPQHCSIALPSTRSPATLPLVTLPWKVRLRDTSRNAEQQKWHPKGSNRWVFVPSVRWLESPSRGSKSTDQTSWHVRRMPRPWPQQTASARLA